MAGASNLLVLAVHEPGLRSMLAAQLSMAGGDVITADDLHDPALEHAMHGTAALIVDQPQVARNPEGWVSSLCDDPRWRHVVVLTVQPPAPQPPGGDSGLLFLDRSTAAAALVELLARWRVDS